MTDIMDDEDKETEKWRKRGARAAKRFGVDELSAAAGTEQVKEKPKEIMKPKEAVKAPPKSVPIPEQKMQPFDDSIPEIELPKITQPQEADYPLVDNPTNKLINPFDNQEIVTGHVDNSFPILLNPNLEDKIDSLPVDPNYQNEAGVRRNEGMYQVPDNKKPSFGETFKHSLEFFNSLGQEPNLNPLSDDTPDGWNAAADEDNFIGVLPKYQGYIAEASSTNDAYFRRLAVLKKQTEDEYFDNGSLLAKITGGFVDSLPFAIVPLGQSAKYATLSKQVIKSMLKASPGLALSNLLHNASVQTHTIGGNLEDTMVETFIDTIGGLAFIGAGAGLSKVLDASKLWDARKVLKMSYDGISPEVKVNKEGKILGYQAVPMDGSVSAAKVQLAQAYLDSTFKKSGVFAIPLVGTLLTKGLGVANPIIRGLNSRFVTLRGFTDRISSHSIRTEGMEKGRAKGEDFESLMGIVQGENKQYYRQMQTLHDQRNDIDHAIPVANLAERTVKRWQKEGYTSADKFGEEIKNVILSGNSHENGAVNTAAAITKEYLNNTWEQWRQVFNLPKDWQPPPTSEGYFPRVYNIPLMIERPQEWEDMMMNWWRDADNAIRQHQQPIEDLRNQIKQMKADHEALIKNANSTHEQIKASVKNINDNRKKLRILKEQLADKIRNTNVDITANENVPLSLLAHDTQHLSGQESQALKKLLKPFQKQQKLLSLAKAELKKVNEKKHFLTLKLNESISKEKIAEIQKQLAELEKDIFKHKEDTHIYEKKLDVENEKLQEAAQTNKINPRFYKQIPNSQRVKFVKPNRLLKFRKPFESEFDMKQQANQLRDRILNQTPEDTMQQVLGHFGVNGREKATMKRKLMMPDSRLQQNGFLSNNLPLIVANYRNSLNRQINLKRVFNDVFANDMTVDNGIGPIVRQLTDEFHNMQKDILNKKLSAKDQAKQLKALTHDFNDAKEFMQLSYDRMMGRSRGNKKLREMTKFMRLWTAATRLGSVPLTMVTDLSANIYKHGFWPSLRDGLLPALQNISHMITKPEGRPYIENAAHAHVALSNVLGAYNDRDWGGMAMQNVPMSGKLGNLMESAAHVSGNIALTNYADNFLQRVAANITQSKIMKYMQDYLKGTLKAKDREKLLTYGLDPKEWAEKFVNNWKAAGSDGNGFGGYLSRYYEWGDAEAANKMSRAIYRGVNDTVIRRGMMDSPFMYDDPLWGTITFLHGWMSASITRYLTPLMQRPDAEHLVGLAVMLAAGSLVSPLRKISRGEAPYDNESNLFLDTLTDSGIASPIMDLVENANILLNNRILRGYTNDRYKQRSQLGAAMGPIFGIGNDVTRILGMLMDRRLNETDVKKAARLIPAMQPWYLKGLQNRMIESLGLPKNASQATPGNAYR